MKKILQISILLIVSSAMNAQSISKQVIGSTGQSITNGTYTINFTVGEAIVGKVENGATIGQGFWSELASDGTLSVEALVNPLEGVKVFPNPTVNLIQIKFKNKNAEDFNAQLFDINGKEIYNLKKSSQYKLQRIDISHLASGMYLLYVRDTQSDYNKTFKILKQ